ncbi:MULTISPECIES: efflux RND transporter periplasmic adaptor subunit [Pseudomonas]|jgi:RND family efflux transporter, MFP subunit|uniref:efflux RND transporter periplasmic adaptor subunit n=1 Tax=Pseudomonas TaxID=286 RepID=UPI00025FE037|nr:MULTISPECIES: HlyD family secretion protein [Pseudomonas]EIK70044.1 auxiliary transport protein, MFP family [Pseudomonas fluorescens Q8r1-96]RDH97286.1 RND family efflux transporter MFP subunit [Pseudomonas fluorescens]ALQ01970.1 Membrane fusion component of tripartite multidrug resistance system [Pseudomonas brassicacearum]AOS39064.1 efflux transporter periplasmic adaptor subunit [Pseudomonas brassicacearum]KAB0522521.1 HlyD family secretion protein [Pseudomonas brassicacearum subsp. brass
MRTSVRVAVTLCMVAVAIFAGFHLWQYYMLTPWTRDARIRADVVVIAPDVSGWVRELKAVDNQQVKAGDVLLSIDRERFEAAVEKARAVVQTRQQQLSLREHEASRRAALGPQAISAELRENAQINAGIARGELREAQAEAKVAELNLARSQVLAPRNGHITNLRLAEGNYVNAGQPVMALIDDSTFYVQAYFEETKLPRIRVGDPVKIWLMSAGHALEGHVESISRGITDRNTNPDAQLLAEVEPTFNWVRLAQRIPVRIKLDKLPEGVNLSAGMTASVQVREDQP